MIIGARFPGRYLQGPGIVARLGQELAGFGDRAIIVLDRGVHDLLSGPLRAACDGHLAIELIRHGGECSKDEIASVAASARAAGARVVLGVGGGKALDTAKAAAHEAGAACVVMPTIAASDAPCSALAVVYKPDGDLSDPAYVAARTDAYFAKTAEIVAAHGDARVTYAVFLRTDAVVAIDRAIAFLEAVYPKDAAIPLTLSRPAPEGTVLASGKPMLYVAGSLVALSPIETLLLQRIGFPCVSAFNAFSMCRALPEADFLAMEARHTTGDDMHLACAYGAAVGSRTARLMGAKGFVGTATDISAPLYGTPHGLGTMPHSLIGYAKARMLAEGRDLALENPTLEAAKLYAAQFPDETRYTVLVDYDGREITDALAVCRWFYGDSGLAKAGKKLAFRLDTHGGRHLEGLDWDESVRTLLKWTHRHTPGEVVKLALEGFEFEELGGMSSDEIRDKFLFGTGVTAAANIFFRKALDDAGFKEPLIVVSSGFDTLKCRVFGNLAAPVDVVGTGSFVPSRISRTYATADIVRYELPDGAGGWKRFDLVKVGREFLKLAD